MSARRSGILVVLAVAACALAGCGATTSDQIKAKVQEFATAVANRDGATLCHDVFAANLLEHLAAAGVSCERAMGIFFPSVQSPRLAVGRVEIKGNTAEAITLTTAHRQLGGLYAIELVDTSGGWRISGLGSSLLPGQAVKKRK